MSNIRPYLKPLVCSVAFSVAIYSGHGAGLGDAADAPASDDATTTTAKSEVVATPEKDADAQKGLDAAMAADKDTKPTDTFPATLPKLYAFWIAHGLANGDKVRGVWIADDVGDVAPKGTKIDEVTMVYAGVNENAFDLTRPTKGWPIGKYHVDLYINDDLAKTVPFSIVAGE